MQDTSTHAHAHTHSLAICLHEHEQILAHLVNSQFIKYLLDVYYVPGVVLDIKDTGSSGSLYVRAENILSK